MTREAEIRARLDAATPGPWVIEELSGDGQERPAVCEVDGTWVFPATWLTSEDMQNTNEDAEFIAHAREDVPWLLARAEAAEAELASVREQRDALRGDSMHIGCVHRAETAEARVAQLEAATEAVVASNEAMYQHVEVVGDDEIVELMARALNLGEDPDNLDREMASAALAALESSGYTVARLVPMPVLFNNLRYDAEAAAVVEDTLYRIEGT